MLIAQLQYQLDNSILTQRTLHLRIGEGDVRVYCDIEADKLQDKLSVPGFRRGRAPLILMRKVNWKHVQPRAFAELKRDALEQVFRLLDKADQPLTPPEVLAESQLRMRYGQALEFAVKYLVDPSGLSANPQQPQALANVAPPISAALAGLPQGVPSGPQLPSLPTSAMQLAAAPPSNMESVPSHNANLPPVTSLGNPKAG